jgi:hypothetical protein
MAVEVADGFDTYTAAQIGRYHPGVYFPSGVSMTTGYGGTGQALQLTALSGIPTVPFPLTPRGEYIFCFDFLGAGTLNTASAWFAVYNSLGAAILELAGLGTSTLYINGTPYANALTGVWQNVTIDVVASAAVGKITVRLDGVTIYAGTGLNTGASLIASALLTGGNAYGAGTVCQFDNFAAFNTLGAHSNALPTGRVRVPALYPVSDGSYQGFTPSSGSNHYSRVNEAQADDDTSYVSSAVATADSYGIQSLPGSGISQVHAVQVRAVHRKDDVNPKVLHVTAQSGLVITETADIAPQTSYGAATLLLTDDPNTASQWTAAAVNAMQPGVKEIS